MLSCHNKFQATKARRISFLQHPKMGRHWIICHITGYGLYSRTIKGSRKPGEMSYLTWPSIYSSSSCSDALTSYSQALSITVQTFYLVKHEPGVAVLPSIFVRLWSYRLKGFLNFGVRIESQAHCSANPRLPHACASTVYCIKLFFTPRPMLKAPRQF